MHLLASAVVALAPLVQVTAANRTASPFPLMVIYTTLPGAVTPPFPGRA